MDPVPEPMPATKPEPAALSVLETKPATQNDYRCASWFKHLFQREGLVVLDNKEWGHPYPPASEISFPKSGANDFLMVSCSQASSSAGSAQLQVLFISLVSPTLKSSSSLLVPPSSKSSSLMVQTSPKSLLLVMVLPRPPTASSFFSSK